ncbi:MAG: nicotinate-nucleotide--dimethylbenzimidazole phosphoribosyltransferase, partial [Geminicoccaceae bacterium]
MAFGRGRRSSRGLPGCRPPATKHVRIWPARRATVAQPRPFADLDAIRARLDALPGPDGAAAAQARAHDAKLTKPAGALGRLEDLAVWLCAWQ